MDLLEKECGEAQPPATERTRKSWFKTLGLPGLKNLWVQLK